MIRSISFILLFACVSVTQAKDIADFSANYLVKLNGFQAGELVRELTTDEQGHRILTATSQAKGMFSFFKPDLIKETSVWTTNKRGVVPLQYLYERTGGKKDKYLSMDFDWSQKQVHIDDKKRPWNLNIPAGVLDKLVYQISLMKDLTPDLESIDYKIADGGKLKNYHIKVLGSEDIKTPMGKIHTLKLTREREKAGDRQTTLWCAPALDYLPVKLEHIEDKTTFIALIRTLKGFEDREAFTPLANEKGTEND
jgi:hypothetical protein